MAITILDTMRDLLYMSQLMHQVRLKSNVIHECALHKEDYIPLVSIIIPTCNNKGLLAKCLCSVSRLDYSNLETIVVDNASSDDTSKLVLERFPGVKILRSERNLGFAAGSNLGIRNAKGTYLIILNDDLVVEPHFVSRLVEAMEAEPRAALGSCKIYDMRREGKIFQNAGGFINNLGYPIARGCGEIDRGQYNRLDEVEWVPGGCTIMRKKCLEAIGLFDDSFFVYYEDTDLSFRARKAGYKVIYIPTTFSWHWGCGVTKRHWRYKVYGNRNRIRFLLRYFGSTLTARAIAWDLWNISPGRAPYLLIALFWNYPILLSAMFPIFHVKHQEVDRKTYSKQDLL